MRHAVGITNNHNHNQRYEAYKGFQTNSGMRVWHSVGYECRVACNQRYKAYKGFTGV